MELSFPSTTFPGPPALRLSFPDGWQPRPVAPAVLSAVDPESPPGFASNVVVIVTRVLHEHPLAELVQSLWDKTLAQYPDAEQLASNSLTVAGLDAHTTTVTMQPPGAGLAVAQVQTVLLTPTSDPVQHDYVQLHGTCALDVLTSYEPVFHQIFDSLQMRSAF